MKYKSALFIASGSSDIDDARPLGEWADTLDDYVRVTDYVDVQYPNRNPREYVEEQIKALRTKQEEIHTDAREKVQRLEDLIRTISALEYKPQ